MHVWVFQGWILAHCSGPKSAELKQQEGSSLLKKSHSGSTDISLHFTLLTFNILLQAWEGIPEEKMQVRLELSESVQEESWLIEYQPPPGSDRAAELTSSNAQLEEQLAGSKDPSSRKRFLRRSIKRPDGERFLLCRLSPELRMTSACYRWSPPTAWPPHAPPAVHRKVTNQERRLLPSSIGAKLRGSCSTRAQPVSFPPPVTHADHDVSWPGGRASQLVQGVERVRADGGSAVSAEEGEPDAGPLPAALSGALPGRVHWAAGAGGRGQQSR